MVERENRGSARAGHEVAHTVPAEASGPDDQQLMFTRPACPKHTMCTILGSSRSPLKIGI